MANLGPLLRLRRRQLDLAKEDVARAQAQRDALSAERARVVAQLAAEAAASGGDPALLGSFATFAAATRARLARLDQSAAQLDARLTELRDALAERFRDLKAVELVDAARAAEETARAARLEAERLDEVALARFRRQQEEG